MSHSSPIPSAIAAHRSRSRGDTTRYYGHEVGGGFSWNGSLPDIHPNLVASLPVPAAKHDIPKDAELGARLEFYLCCEQFLAFLRGVSLPSLGEERSGQTVLEPQCPDFVFRRANSFQPSSPLYRLLCPRPEIGHGIIQMKDHFIRLNCLLHINCALWQWRSDPWQAARYLKFLTLEVIANDLDANPSVASLIWLLFDLGFGATGRKFGDESLPERLWFAGRMVAIARRVICPVRNLGLWDLVNKVLFDALVSPASEAHVPDRQLPYDEDELRHAITQNTHEGRVAYQWAEDAIANAQAAD